VGTDGSGWRGWPRDRVGPLTRLELLRLAASA
jgi:hypothetical protein